MSISSRHRNRRAARTEIEGCGWRCVQIRVASTVTQLTTGVLTPALQVAIVEDGTGVESSRHHGVGVHERGPRRVVVLERDVTANGRIARDVRTFGAWGQRPVEPEGEGGAARTAAVVGIDRVGGVGQQTGGCAPDAAVGAAEVET